MSMLTSDQLDFLQFLFEEYKSAAEAGRISTYLEEFSDDEFLWENLASRLQANSPHILLSEGDMTFLKHISDVHLQQSRAGIGRLWKDSAENEESFTHHVVAEVQKLHDAEKDRWLTYEGFSGTYQVLPHLGIYDANHNLYIGLYAYDTDWGGMDHFSDITVNIGSLPYLHAAIDTNNNGQQILAFLNQYELGEQVGTEFSGFCAYPIYRFQEEKIRNIDPAVFEEYAKAHPERLLFAQNSLNNQISRGEEKKGASQAAHVEQDRESPDR